MTPLLGRRVALPLLVLALAACDTNAGADGQIVPYDGPAITEANAAVDNGLGIGQTAGWTGVRLGDGVSISRATLCGDECGETLELEFENGAPLPSGIDGTFGVVASFPDRTETRPLDIARVEIQDWGPEVYSGVVYLEPDDEVFQFPIVFWVDAVGGAQE